VAPQRRPGRAAGQQKVTLDDRRVLLASLALLLLLHQPGRRRRVTQQVVDRLLSCLAGCWRRRLLRLPLAGR
jgi:hypothetical protein